MGKNGKKIFENSLNEWDLEYIEKKSLTNEDSFLLNIKKIEKKFKKNLKKKKEKKKNYEKKKKKEKKLVSFRLVFFFASFPAKKRSSINKALCLFVPCPCFGRRAK